MKHSRWSYVVVLWLTWFVVGLLNSGVQPVGATAAAAPTERGSVITEVLQAAQPISPDIASQGLLATDALSETTAYTPLIEADASISEGIGLSQQVQPFCKPTYGNVTQWWSSVHPALDISGIGGTVKGPAVYAPYDGTVTYAAWENGGCGWRVRIAHGYIPSMGQSIDTIYCHMGSRGTSPSTSLSYIQVANGHRVKRGQIIGYQGSAGAATGTHLHWQLVPNTLNPATYMTNNLCSNASSPNTPTPPRDTTLPEGGITAPTNNTTFTNRNPITISAWATDAGSGVDRVEFMVWRNNVWYKHFVDTTPPYAATWVPNTDVRNGERFILAIHVIDRAGNRRSDAGGWRYLTYQAPSQTLYATRFAAVHSGKVLDVSEVSTRAWQPLHQWDWVNGDNQKFILTRVEGDWYEIKAVHSGLCLDISWASRERGARLIQYYCNRGHNQQFRLYDFGAIQVRHTGMVLDVWDNGRHNGAAIVQWPWHGGNNQRWNRATVTYQRRLALADEGTVGPLQTDPADWQFSDYINQRALSDSSVPADQKAAAVGVATVLDHYGMYTAEEIEQLVERVMPEGQASLHTMQHALAEAGLDTTVVRPTDAATTWSTLTNTLTLGVPVIFYSPPGEMTESGHVIIVKDYIEQDGHQYVIAHDPFGQWQGTCCKDNYAANPTRSTGSQGAWVRYDLALLPNHAQRWLLIAQPQSSATAIGQDPVATVGEFEMLSDDSDLYITGELPIVAVEQSGTGDLEPVSQPPMSVPDEMPETVVPTPTPEPLQIVTFAGATIQSNDTIYLPLIVRGQ